jgi:hypothetical protein
MKRVFQIAGVLLILVLGAGPASAAIGCVLSNPAMGQSCPMGVAGMDADCPMSHALAPRDCSQDCCNRTAPIAVVLSGLPVKPKLVAAAPAIARLNLVTAAKPHIFPEILPPVAANSPPRYILLRVFRI